MCGNVPSEYLGSPLDCEGGHQAYIAATDDVYLERMKCFFISPSIDDMDVTLEYTGLSRYDKAMFLYKMKPHPDAKE